MNDFAKWSGLSVADARIGLEGVQASLVHQVVEGKTFWFPPSKAVDRSRERHQPHICFRSTTIRRPDSGSECHHQQAERRQASAMGNALSHIVVVGGRIVGTWKRRVERGALAMKTDIFERLTKAEDRAVSAAIHSTANSPV